MLAQHSLPRRLALLTLVLVAVAFSNSARSEAALINGDFESQTGDGNAAATTFTSWSERVGDQGSGAGNAAIANTTSPISGGISAQMTGASTQLFQNLTPASNPLVWSVGFDFAVFSGAGGSRTMNVLFKHHPTTTTEQINLRALNTSGQIQVFDGVAWQNIGTLTVNATTDTGAVGWTGETPVVNSLTVAADYSTTPSYSVTLNGNTVSGLSIFHNAPAAGAEGLLQVAFRRDTGTGTSALNDYLVDNVVAIPEPATFGLAAFVGLALLAARRCGCANR